ncbi:hypothetical protein ACFQZ4_37895 [Catellatospora coxensis]|uniref:Uncharacterized protein n=1 Tax=Catellatospora coxensis TaxID=310354 RepID=A0A8J3KP29_9ACTN|nr:hypothetical protein [Catellatospora coxensis]GIG03658.1 hypothetical protein Cco03nite_03580 [Catellatospora coxensis]
MNVGHAELMHVAATFLRAHPEHVADLSAWLAWALPRGVDAAKAEATVVDEFCQVTGAGCAWLRSWRRTCRERLGISNAHPAAEGSSPAR